MQLRSMFTAIALLALPCGCLSALLRMGAQQEAISAAASAAWASVAEAEADDQRFWKAQWAALESTLLQLEKVGTTSMLQVGSGTPPRAGNNSKLSSTLAQHPSPAARNHSERGSSPPQHPSPLSNTSAQRASPAAGNHSELGSSPAQDSSPLAGFKLPPGAPKSTAELLPTLAMLKGLYEDGKERIAKLNAREKQSKQRYDEMLAKHEARLATIEARFKNGTLSADFRTNETRDENRLWSYWQRVRERQHRQFHTSLKIQHGTMQKVKTMIDMYEETISGKADTAQVRKDLAKVAGVVPEVVLLQEAWRAAAPYFHEALAEVRRQSVELGEGLLRQ